MRRLWFVLLLLIISLIPLPQVYAATIFSDDFEDITILTDSWAKYSVDVYVSSATTLQQTVYTFWNAMHTRFWIRTTVKCVSSDSQYDVCPWQLTINVYDAFGNLVDSVTYDDDTTGVDLVGESGTFIFTSSSDVVTNSITVEYVIEPKPGYDVWLNIYSDQEVLVMENNRDFTFNENITAAFSTLSDGGGSRSFRIYKATESTGITTVPAEGVAKFSVYYDRSLNFNLSSFAKIGANGYIEVMGKTTNLTLIPNQWNVVVVAWSSTDQDYVYVNNVENIYYLNITSINLNYFGDPAATTNTLIDNIEITDTYMTPLEALFSGQGLYGIVVDEITYIVHPEGGNGLPNITVTFLDEGKNVLGTAQLSSSEPVVNAPAGTKILSLVSDNVERIYDLDGISSRDLAFPGVGELAVKVIKAYVYPPVWNKLEIKTLDGKIVFRDNITTEASFTALYGRYYVFTVENEEQQVKYSITAQATDNMQLKFPDPDSAFQLVESDKFIAKKDGDSLVLEYLGKSATTGNITIIAHDKNGKVVYNVTQGFSGIGYISQLNVKQLEGSLNTSISYFKVSVATASGFKATKVVANKISFKYLMLDNIFPNGFRLIFFGLLGLFLVGRKYVELGPFLAFLTLGILQLIEWVQVPTDLTVLLSVTGSLGLFATAKEKGWLEIPELSDNLASVKIWRIPISYWLLVVLISYSLVLAHMFMPWFDYNEYYYTVKFMDSTVLQWFRGLAESSNWVVSTIGYALFVGATGLKALFMLLEGVVTGFYPTWKALGWAQPINNSPITVAHIMSSIVYMSYAWTLYMARKGGVEA